MKQIIIFVILIFILLILVSLLRTPISRGEILKPARLFVQIFCPPKDLFQLVMDKNIDITNTDNIQTFEFKIKYIGPYSVGILLDKFSDDLYRKKYELKLRAKLDFYKNAILLMSKETTSDYIPFYGKRGNGLMLFEFTSPEDIPIDTKITCKVKVLITDEYLNNRYGPARLYIQKISEE